MRLPSHSAKLLTGVALLALTLAGCSATPSADGATDGTTDGAKITVVASTNVWGDIAAQIGGDAINVSSLISDPAQDPHSFEADAQVQLALSKADVVVENGGGYDDYVETLLRGADNSTATVLNAVDISGFDQEPATGELNEHVWYDFPTVKEVAAEITKTFSKLDAANADTFTANEKAFGTAVDVLAADTAALKTGSAAGSGVAITEPVPLYLLSAAGLINKTPAEFSEAIEEGTDVAPTVMQKTLALFSEKTVSLLAYNKQTTGPETEKVLAAAKAAGIAIVPVTETLPKGKNYLSWMTDNVDAVATALK